MKRRKEVPAMPPGYMTALGKLYGKPAEDGPETAPERTQSTGALQMGDGLSATVDAVDAASDGASGNDDRRGI